MLKKLSTYFIGFFLSVSIFAYTSDNENSIPEINYSKFTLDNGLTVIVHEDRKAVSYTHLTLPTNREV